MATVFDAAAYVLAAKGPMSAMKLQKLVYYSQAWSLVWTERPLFQERIEAWANGPVAPELYARHRGAFIVSDGDIPGDPSALSVEERDTINVILEFYGEKPAQWLSELSHNEAPWKEAREDLPDGVRGNREITLASMAEYYGSL